MISKHLIHQPNAQAVAVAAYLDSMEPDFADWDEGLADYLVEVSKAEWHNGREQGYVYSVRKPGSKTEGHVAFFEHRNCDEIHAVAWMADALPFGKVPTLEDIPDGVYETKYDSIPIGQWGEAGKAAMWIYEKLGDFYSEQEA